MQDKTDTPTTTSLVKQDYGIDVGRVVAMRAAVEEVISKVLREGEHFGVLPGTVDKDGKTKDGKKPKKMLFQPGAEVLCQVFRVRPEYKELAVVETDDFISIKILCRLFNSVTGEQVGEAIGSANSREDKYASQAAAKLCPVCAAPTIFKSKDGGWFCWVKKGGCGATFGDADKKLLDQTGTVSIQRLYSLYHTLESIAQKRSFVKATRSFTATSDIFTDEDVPSDDDQAPQQQPKKGATPAPEPKEPMATPELTRDLNFAIKDSKMCEPPAGLPDLERDAQAKAKRLRWINLQLEDEGCEPIERLSQLTLKQAQALIAKAKAKQTPSGW